MPQDIILTISDKSGDKATTMIQIDEAVIADMVDFTEAYATAVNDITLGKIESAVAMHDVATNLLTANSMVATADVEHLGKFQFAVLGATHRVACNIPSLNEAAVLAHASDTLDQAEPEVAAFIAAMVSGIAVAGPATIQPCDIGGLSLTEVIFAREGFKNSGARR